MSEAVRGRVDGEGRLIEADVPLLALHLRAGGSEGGVLAPPQLAALVRLVRRIGIAVSRGVIVADEDGDLDLWVRAEPEATAACGWRSPAGRAGRRSRRWTTAASRASMIFSAPGPTGRGRPTRRCG